MPLTRPDTVVTPPGTPVTFRPTANDEGPTLVVIALGSPGFGTVAHNADQSLTYTPNAGFAGTDAFTYTIADAAGGTADGAVTIVVDSLPVAVDDTAATTPGIPVVIPAVANDNDPDADPLTIVGVSSPGHGSVEVLPDQTLRYQSQRDFTGVDSFSYTVIDGRGLQASATVAVTVAAADQAPDVVADHVTTAVDAPATIDLLANDHDPDGDPLTLVGLTIPEHGTVAVNADSSVTYRPAAGFAGEDRFTYTMADGRGRSASAEVSVDVVRQNRPPHAGDVAAVTPAGAAVTVSPLGQASDPDNDPVQLTALTLPAHGRLTVNPGQTVTYTPATGFSGEEEFSYTVEDGRGGGAVGAIRIDVQPPLAPPAFANGYAYRRRIVVPARPAAGEPAEGFVIRVDECAGWLRSKDQGGRVQNAAGFDLRFELEDGARLAHEVELYDGVAGRLLAWVRAPSWSLDQQLRLFLYYGKAGLTAAEADPVAAWADYLAVWNTRSGIDRSGHGRHLTPGALENADLIGPAARFPGNAVATLTDASWCGGLAALTLQCWAKAETATLGSDRGLLDQGARGASAQGVVLRYAGAGDRGGAANVVVWGVQTSAGFARLESAANAQDTAPQMLHAVWRSGELPRLHLDGVATAASWAGAVVNNVATAGQLLTGTTVAASGGLTLGAGSTSGDAGAWLGLIDEARMRATAPSPARIAAEYASQSDPDGFYGVSDEDDPTTNASSVAVPLAVGTSAGARVDVDVLTQSYVPAGCAAPAILSVTQPGNGLATIVSGKVRYTPNAGFAGCDSLTYTIGAGGKTSTAPITVAVAALAPELPTPLRTVNVSTYAALSAALADAQAGDQIVLADGTYSGNAITVSALGTPAHPVVIKALNKLGAIIKFAVTLSGNNIWTWGVHYLTTGCIFMNGNNNRVTRCKFSDSTNGACIKFGLGAFGAVDHCDITVRPFDGTEPAGVTRFGITVVDKASNRHTDGHIYRNLFHDFSHKPIPDEYGSGFNHPCRCGEGPSDSTACLRFLVEYNLFEDCLPGNSILETKTSDNIYRYNTIRNCPQGILVMRNGQRTQVYGNTLIGCEGIRVLDMDHVITSNDVSGAAVGITLQGGNVACGTASTTDNPPATNVAVVANIGKVLVGKTNSTNPPSTLPCTGTRIEKHMATDSSADDSPNITLSTLQTNTTISATTARTTYTPVCLSRGDVGPDVP